MERSRWQLSHGDPPILVPRRREVKGSRVLANGPPGPVIQRTTFSRYPCDNRRRLPPEDACVTKTVLVIDDEALIRDLLKDSLETLGIQVLLAADLAGGIRVLSAANKDVDL